MSEGLAERMKMDRALYQSMGLRFQGMTGRLNVKDFNTTHSFALPCLENARFHCPESLFRSRINSELERFTPLILTPQELLESITGEE